MQKNGPPRVTPSPPTPGLTSLCCLVYLSVLTVPPPSITMPPLQNLSLRDLLNMALTVVLLGFIGLSLGRLALALLGSVSLG